MIASRNKRAGMRPGFIAAVAGAAFLWAGDVQAQGPQSLEPPKPLAPPAAVTPADAPASEPTATAPAQPGETSPAVGGVELEPSKLGTGANTLLPGKIEVESLQTIDANSVGVLTEEAGGFGIGMWDGTSRARVERLISKLPVGATSRAMHGLMRRLLLSTAKAPAGESLSKDGKSDLIGTRVELLANMGDLAGVSDLLKVVPVGEQTDRLLKSEADLLFLGNDNARVCSLVASQIKEVDTDYWQKAFIFCQSLAGQYDRAALGANLLRETGTDDSVFFGIIETLAGLDKYEVASLSDPKPLHFAMIRAARVKLPADVTSANNPAILKTIATSPNASPELRVDAAERAEAMGALNTDVLRQLYAGITFGDQALANPLTTADAERNPLSRALLYRKALVESVPAAIAEVLAKAFNLAREEGRFESMARVYLPILRGIEPAQDFIWFAPDAVRAFLAARETASALQWLSMLKSAAAVDEGVAGVLNGLLPLARIAGLVPDEEWEPEILDRWWAARTKQSEEKQVNMEEAVADAALLYDLMSALGDQVPAARWDALLDGPPQGTALMPQPAIWRSLKAASNNVRVGETVLLSLLALGGNGPIQANPTVMNRVVYSLWNVGLGDDARSLALEAALAAGI
jgi:hypothetical protein